ncbi:MAG: tetratricopeptide repeat protein, partial [Blastocatellia bacterium]|nr:tetratricopeptide repeat protein [Blastocatellia bacterium]
GEAYATRGFIEMFHNWDWEAAEADLLRSIELNPGYPTAHQWYATLLMIRGRPLEAEARLKEALLIDPGSYNLYGDLAQAQFFARKYDEAERSARKALEIYPNFIYAHAHLASIYLQTERIQEAISQQMLVGNELNRYSPTNGAVSVSANDEPKKSPDASLDPEVVGYWRWLAKNASQNVRRDPNGHISIATAAIKLGDKRAVYHNLGIAIDQHAFMAPFVNVDPMWDPVRNEPEFRALMRKMGL